MEPTFGEPNGVLRNAHGSALPARSGRSRRSQVVSGCSGAALCRDLSGSAAPNRQRTGREQAEWYLPPDFTSGEQAPDAAAPRLLLVRAHDREVGVRSLAVVVGLVLLVFVAWVMHQRWENDRYRFDQKHGYWLIREQVPMPRGWFERQAHYTRLYDRSIDLDLVWGFSIAPDGSRAVLERPGAIVVYDRQGVTVDTVLTDSAFVDHVHGYEWDPAASTVRITNTDGRDTLVSLARRP